ncbi:MAG: hypothetical protein ACP5OY_05410 [Halothiobacillaceae bacterium]
MHPVLAQSPDQPALTQILLEQAASTPRGTFPRAFHGEQAYWTAIGEPDSPHAALLSKDGLLPQEALRLTFDEYLAMVRERAAGSPRWPGYTPYEWRNVEALVRMGRREEAWVLLRRR